MPELNTSTETFKGQSEYSLPWDDVYKNVKSVTIGNGITSVGAETFRSYSNLTSISIGKDVKRLGAGCFSLGATTSINVDAENASFKVVDGCLLSADGKDLILVSKDKTALTIPATVKRVLFESIRNYKNLETLNWADGAAPEFIGYCSLGGLTSLSNLDFPSTINYYGPISVYGCNADLTINCASKDVAMLLSAQMDKPYNLKINGSPVSEILHSETVNGLTLKFLCNNGEAVLYSQSGTPETESMTIPDVISVDGTNYKVTTIGGNVFMDFQKNTSDATLLKSIQLSNNTSRIGCAAFSTMPNIESIVIPATSVTIDYIAFYNDSKLYLDISNATTLEFSHLSNSNFNKIAGLIIKDESMLEQALYGLRQSSSYNTNTTIYIGSREGSTLRLDNEGKFIAVLTGDYTDAQGLTYTLSTNTSTNTNTAVIKSLEPKNASITFPDNVVIKLANEEVNVKVTGVASDFSINGDVDIVTSLTFNGENLTYNADFSTLTNLQSVTINGKTTFAKSSSFANLAQLKELNINAYVNFSRNCFDNCTGLTSLAMTKGGTMQNSFTKCYNITSMSFTDGDYTIAPFAVDLDNMSNLKSLFISGGVIEITPLTFHPIRTTDITFGKINHLTLSNYNFSSLQTDQIFDFTKVGTLNLSNVGFGGDTDAADAAIFSKRAHKIFVADEDMYLLMLKGAYWQKTANPYSDKYVTAFAQNNIKFIANGGTYDTTDGKVKLYKDGLTYEAKWYEATYDRETLTQTSLSTEEATSFVAGKTYYAKYDDSKITVTDRNEYSGSVQKENVAIDYTRSYREESVGKWLALYVPFDITVNDELLKDFDFAQLVSSNNTTTDNDNDGDLIKLHVKKLTNGTTISGNTPCFIMPKSAGVKTLSVLGTTLYPAKNATYQCGKVTLTGVYSPMSLYDMFAMLYTGQFSYYDNNATLSPNRWYMTINVDGDKASYAEKLQIVTDNESETTGITSVNAESNSANVLYTIDGRKVSNNRPAPGIYIINGHKMVIK